MEDKKNLDDLIKNSFDKINKGVPDNLWGKLSSALDADAGPPQSTEKNLLKNPLDGKVKESFSSLSEKAPKHVWTAINRQLNIERVWEGISSELDKTKPLFLPGNRLAAAVLLLLLLGAGTYVLLNSEAVNPELAGGQVKETGIKGESFVAFDSGEAIEAKEQKAGSFSPRAVSKNNAAHPKMSVPANDKFDIKDQKERFTVDGNALHQMSGFQGSKGIATSGNTTIQSSPSFSKQDGFLQPLPDSIYKNTNEVKGVADNRGFARRATKDRNEILSMGHDKKVRALGHTDGLNRGPLSTDEIIPLKVNRLPITQEKNPKLVKVEAIQLDTLPVQQIALKLPHDKKERNILNIRNFEGGPVWVYHNSWLLNNETRNSFDKNSLISTGTTYKQNWGMTFNYNLTSKSSLATEAHFFSKSAQQYNVYGEGEYLKKGLELRYHKIYLQYQRHLLKRGTGIPGWVTVKAGVYGGILQEKRGELRQEESRYANFDYGFRLAAGQENRFGRVIIGYGLSTERGLKNVFRGTEKLPATFNKTYIQNIGTYLNVRYAF